MTNYAYIDESGTESEHQVMIVSLVLLNGRKTAEHHHLRVLKALYPHLLNNPKVLSKKKLHFHDMPENARNIVAKHLVNTPIRAVINSYWHYGKDESHGIIFRRYTKMVQCLLYRALELTTGKLRVVIAQQGGWETYENAFLETIHRSTELFLQRNRVFRDVEYSLKPAQNIYGLRLADFYAGVVCKMFLDNIRGLESHLSSPYNYVQHQIILEDFIDLE